jgi:anti-sigma factor RsiW
MNQHPSWERLNDFVDDCLTTEARSATAAHVLQCPACRSQLDGLRRLTTAARQLPPASIEPEGQDWDRVARAIGAPLPRASAWWQRPRTLVAAAGILVAASSGLTALALRGDWRAEPAQQVVSAPESAPLLQPASWHAVEQGYLASVDELRALLDGRRESLSPKTVAMVERHLATIDAAIAEARAALLGDPANAELAGVLAKGYRHKVELLRRATQLQERS